MPPGREFDFVTMFLPSNPVKTRDIAKYGDDCWELDALPPDDLKMRVRSTINSYIDEFFWEEDTERLEHERKEAGDGLRKMLGKRDDV